MEIASGYMGMQPRERKTLILQLYSIPAQERSDYVPYWLTGMNPSVRTKRAVSRAVLRIERDVIAAVVELLGK